MPIVVAGQAGPTRRAEGVAQARPNGRAGPARAREPPGYAVPGPGQNSGLWVGRRASGQMENYICNRLAKRALVEPLGHWALLGVPGVKVI